MKFSSIKGGTILSFIQMFASIIIGLVYTPLMIKLLGQNEYGLYQTVSSTIATLSILNLGFNSSYIRFFTKYKKENNMIAVYELNGLFMIVFIIIGIVAFSCGIIIRNHINLLFDKGLTSEEYEIARILMLILTINLAISFPISVLVNIIYAHQMFIEIKIIEVLITVLGPFITLPLLINGYRSVAVVIVTLALNIVADFLYVLLVLFKLKQKFVFKKYEKSLIKNLFSFTIFITINLIIDQIYWNIDKLLLARYKGTAQVTIYSIGYSIYNLYMMFSCSISSFFTPRIHNIYNEYKTESRKMSEKFSELFTKIGRIQFLVLALIMTGMIFWGKPFINYWVGEGYEESYWVALLLMLPSSIPFIQNIGIEIQRAMNKHKFRSIAYLIMAVFNLLISIFLCKLYGAVGSAVGTAVSLVLANGLIMNIYYHKYCHIDILLFWKNIVLQLKGLFLPIIFAIILKKVILLDSFLVMICEILLYTIVYILSVWSFSMNEYEKKMILNLFKKTGEK